MVTASRGVVGLGWGGRDVERTVTDGVRFRVYPEAGSSLFAVVQVFEKKAVMLVTVNRMIAASGLRRSGRETAAVTLTLQRRHIVTNRLTPLFAEANFHRARFDESTIAHEAAHVAFAWADRIKLGDLSRRGGRMVPNGEERFCYALGRIVEQMTERGGLGSYG